MSELPYLDELRQEWFPHITDSGLDRLIGLLESGSPLLIHGAFARVMPMGCLATHIAWHHPRTASLDIEAGISWLSKVAGLNPATSKVIRVWDSANRFDLELRHSILEACRVEQADRKLRPSKSAIHNRIRKYLSV